MSVSKSSQKLVENRLLAALPRQEYERLLPNLETVSLDFKQVIYAPSEPIEHVYFPNNGVVVSLLSIMKGSTAAEVGLVGNEGMAGLPVFLGVDTTPSQAIVQVPGDSIRMKADVFKALVNRSDTLHGLLMRYTHALMIEISQSVGCKSHHSIEQRCCRWLLMNHDRAGSDQFPITQEFLSHMLGVRRAGITEVAGMLQKAGLIRYSRGQMTILDRLGLEDACCECYRTVKAEFERLTEVDQIC